MHTAQRPGRLGIVGMRERAIAAGGSLDVRQHVEKWIVNATFPKGRLNEAGGGG
jgi:signal transduction histidine kinase